MKTLTRAARAAAAACLAAILAFSLLPLAPPPAGGVGDKWGHFLAYAAAGFAIRLGWDGRWGGVRIVVALALLGGVIEVAQGLIGRSAELADLAADAAGAGVAVALAALAARLIRRCRRQAARRCAAARPVRR